MEGSNGDQKVHSLAEKTPNDNDTIIAKSEGLQEKKGAEIIVNLPTRQKLEKSNSFNEKRGSKTQQRFKTILDRNTAASPGASHHTPRR